VSTSYRGGIEIADAPFLTVIFENWYSVMLAVADGLFAAVNDCLFPG
jgi:hypothetical protein